MRQHARGAGWDTGGLPGASGRAGPRLGRGAERGAERRSERRSRAGQIVELPDPGYLPRREGLRRIAGSPGGRDVPLYGQIVDDLLDGHRVYPEPPRRGRAVHRLERLMDRVSPPVWLFVLLAVAQGGAILADAWPSGAGVGRAIAGASAGGGPATITGAWSAPFLANLALRLGGASAAALLPAAVLIWRSDAWRSARAVLVGAIAWTTLPAGASLAWWVVRRSPVLMDRIGYEVAVGVAAATVVAYLGPGIVAVGLERLRRRRTAWLDYWAQRGAAVTVLATLYNVARWTPPAADASGGFAPPVQAGPAGLDTLHLAATVGAAALPVELLCLSILAFVCFSAVSDGEAQRRLWQCAAAGAGLLAAIAVYQLLAAELPANVSSTGPAGSGWEAAALGATLMAGFGLVSLAFGSPVWSAARDAEGAGRAAPEAIFAWGTAAEADGSDPIPMSTVMAVAAGADHALALDDQGRVGSWGDDSMGQADVPAGLSGVVAVAAGNGFSLALRSDGTVAGWGANDLGQTNLPAGLSGVAAIAAGSGFGLALKADGTVAGWGDGGLGETALPAGLCDVTAISAGKHHALALRADGTLVAWGDDSYGQADVPPGLRRVKAISAGGDFSLALLADGTVVAWGDDSYGQLDVPAGLASVVEISAGAFHALALRADGDVVGWGGGGQRFGEAFHPWRLVDFKAVAAGDGFSLAIRAA